MAYRETIKIEFELTITKFQDENTVQKMYDCNNEVKPAKWKEYETLNFKALSAVEVLRKLIDYLEK